MNAPSWLASIHHDGSEKYVSTLTPHIGQTVGLRLRMAYDAPVQRVILRTYPDGEQMLSEMRRVSIEPPAQWWEVDFVVSQPVCEYRFVIVAADGVWHYSAAGLSAYVPLDSTDFRLLANYQPPEWLREAVFYQIFPDRFANGDPSNDPQPDEFEFRGHRPATYPWGTPPPEGQIFPLVYYGGDLPGIEQHLDYLTNLGINALYLNPIFRAYSNHKYDVVNYHEVDPHFGGDVALIALRRALDSRGMRYILDIVPNHCGYWHPWFQAARSNILAPETELFTFRNHPDDYATWLGVQSLPKLNYLSQELRNRIYEAPESVFRHWLKPPFSADGWRVDVANMLGRQGLTQVGSEITRGIRAAVKASQPDAYLMGENFFDASLQLQGDQWDGVMNYGGFTQPLLYWLRGYELSSHGFPEPVIAGPWSTSSMVDMWRSRMAAIPWVINLQQYNLLGSHDTPRIQTVVNCNDNLHRLAASVLLTFPGVPGLYYGDEIGLEDLPGLGPRGCMIWEETQWNHSLLEHYRTLIHQRRTSSILQSGGFQVLVVETDTIAYQREGLDGRILVIAHRGQSPRPGGPLSLINGGVPDGTSFSDILSGKSFTVHNGSISLPALEQGALILQALL
jgi:alpha-glucosidase